MNKQNSSQPIVEPIFRDVILGKVINYSLEHNHMFSLVELQRFDPQYNPDYEQEFLNFVQSVKTNQQFSSITVNS